MQITPHTRNSAKNCNILIIVLNKFCFHKTGTLFNEWTNHCCWQVCCLLINPTYLYTKCCQFLWVRMSLYDWTDLYSYHNPSPVQCLHRKSQPSASCFYQCWQVINKEINLWNLSSWFAQRANHNCQQALKRFDWHLLTFQYSRARK